MTSVRIEHHADADELTATMDRRRLMHSREHTQGRDGRGCRWTDWDGRVSLGGFSNRLDLTLLPLAGLTMAVGLYLYSRDSE